MNTNIFEFSNLELDKMNPRFSLFNFTTEQEIIEYLLQFENLYELIDSYLFEGYNTLGERLIILKGRESNTVLEGNRRVAAIKCLFKYDYLLKASYREKIKNLDPDKFQLACDIVENRSDANYKIAAKHIASIKGWNSIDKYVYYYNSFQHLLSTHTVSQALEFIKSTTPDSISQIKKDIKYFKFLSRIHSLVKSEYPELKPLSHLENDVLTSRVYSALKRELNLHEEQWIELKIPSDKNEEYSQILKLIGKAAWLSSNNSTQNLTLNTRTFQRQDQWKDIIDKDELIPGLKTLILQWNSNIKKISEETNPEDFTVNEINQNKHINNPPLIPKMNTTSNNQPKTSGSIPLKYQLIIDSNWADNAVIYNLKDTDLVKATLLYDDKSNKIPLKSSVYEKISFKATPEEGILLKKSTILKNSKPGNYVITALFGNQSENFKISIINKSSVEAPDFKESFIHDKWLKQMIASLQKSHKFDKIITILITLSSLTNKDKILSKSEVLIVTFLIRALLEYVSKAYIDHFEISNNKLTSENLPQLVKTVAEDMFNKKNSQFTIEKKKAIKANDDIELLNGVIHDYTTLLSNQDFKRIFAKYIPFVESVILSIESK